MGVPSNDLHAGELVHAAFFAVFVERPGRRLAGGHEERQLECFRRREAARRVADDGPDQIDHTVAHLIDELRRRAAERHGVELVDLNAAARIRHHLLAPGRQRLGWNRRLWRQHLVEA